jgi:aldehyde dehydrogenase (NAD+)
MEAIREETRPTARHSGFDRLPIAGRWRQGKGKRVLRDRNPYSGEVLLETPQASRDDLDAAYAGAVGAGRARGSACSGARAGASAT